LKRSRIAGCLGITVSKLLSGIEKHIESPPAPSRVSGGRPEWTEPAGIWHGLRNTARADRPKMSHFRNAITRGGGAIKTDSPRCGFFKDSPQELRNTVCAILLRTRNLESVDIVT
jgi:hypothetical protein